MTKKSPRQELESRDAEQMSSRKTARTEEIYRKATRLFREKGYLKTTMNDIARELGMQKGSLYYHTKDKEALLFEILNRTMNRILSRVSDLSLHGLSPEEKLRCIAHEHFKNMKTYPNELWLLMNEGKNLSRKRRDVIREKRLQYERIFLEVIEEGFFQKVFSKHNKHLVAYFVLGGMYWLFQWFSPKDMVSGQLDEESFLDLFFNGLLDNKSR